MLTTVRSHSSRHRAMRLRWPAWRAPMVGTNPTCSPAQRQASVVDRRSGTSVITASRSAAIVRRPSGLAPIRVLRPRKGPLGDLTGEGLHGLDRLGAEVGVALDEPRGAPPGQAEKVMDDQHLAIAVGPGADPNRGDAERSRDLGRHLGGHRLKDQAERSRLLQLAGILKEAL